MGNDQKPMYSILNGYRATQLQQIAIPDIAFSFYNLKISQTLHIGSYSVHTQKLFEKLVFLIFWYAHVRMHIMGYQGVRNVVFCFFLRKFDVHTKWSSYNFFWLMIPLIHLFLETVSIVIAIVININVSHNATFFYFLLPGR